MFQRLSCKALLHIMLGFLALAAILPPALWAAQNWRALQANRRALAVTEVSRDIFTLLINIRSDRNSVARAWDAPDPIAPGLATYIRSMHTPEMAAFHRTVEQLERIDFPSRNQALPALRGFLDKMTSLQGEFWDGVAKPKATRRPGVGAEYLKVGIDLQPVLEDVAATLFNAIRHTDSIIDQMMTVKQLAWQARNSTGEASLMVSLGLAAGKVAPDAQRRFDDFVGGAKAAWQSLEETIARQPLPADFGAAINTARAVAFGSDFLTRREQTIGGLIAGQKPGMTADEWAQFGVPKMGTIQAVAEAALNAARDQAAVSVASAQRQLGIAGLVLASILAIVVFGFNRVEARLIQPLLAIRDAMHKLADGDTAVTVPAVGRTDEIGQMAGAVQVFKSNRIAADKLTGERDAEQQVKEQRVARLNGLTSNFEAKVGQLVGLVSSSATELQTTAESMSGVASQTTTQTEAVASAAERASANVQTVATAAGQLATSIAEITQQISQSARITGEAVEASRRTDGVVQALAEGAQKIGEVVRLISDIAGQTNLLALNATIEAARAGEAGKGFAVVASEVKGLATQTAKATEQISQQVSQMQSATRDAVASIQAIGGKIAEVSEIATAIGAAMEEQGAATQEIARNVQQAASGTQDVTSHIGGVSEGASNTGNAARHVLDAAGHLSRQAVALSNEMDQFIGQVKAA